LSAGVRWLVSAANGNTVSSAGGSDTNKGVAVVQDQRTPVVSLTGTMGDVGFEIFDGVLVSLRADHSGQING